MIFEPSKMCFHMIYISIWSYAWKKSQFIILKIPPHLFRLLVGKIHALSIEVLCFEFQAGQKLLLRNYHLYKNLLIWSRWCQQQFCSIRKRKNEFQVLNKVRIKLLWLILLSLLPFKPRHDKTNKMNVRPANSDQPGQPPSLIKVFAVRMKKPWVFSYPLSAQRRLWSDWAYAKAELSLRWAHCLSFCWFCHFAAHLVGKLVWC